MEEKIRGTVDENDLREIIENVVKEEGISLNEEEMEKTCKECIVKIVKKDEKMNLVEKENLEIDSQSLSDKEKQARIDYYTQKSQSILQDLLIEEFFEGGD